MVDDFSPDEEMSAESWAQKAMDEFKAAQVLAESRLWSQSFYHAGFAIECALKSRIMRDQRLNRWPSRKDRRELYAHDLGLLSEAANLQDHLLAEIGAGTQIGIGWQVVKDWQNAVRYDPRPFPARRAKDMLEAVGALGVLVWLLNT